MTRTTIASLVIGVDHLEAAGEALDGPRRRESTGVHCPSLNKGAPGPKPTPLLCVGLEAYGVLVSPVVGNSVLGWFMVTSTPFWSD